jgi:hypothetical protein
MYLMRVRENKWPDSSFFLVGLMFFPRNIRPRMHVTML